MSFCLVFPAASEARTSNVLLDTLVRKGVLTQREAEEIRGEDAAATPRTSAEKLRLSSSLSELRLSGDARIRFQYDNKQAQLPVTANNTQRNRWRFRLRLNANYRFAGPFWGGVQLTTGKGATSSNATFTNAYEDYGIYISKVFIGWQATDWMTLVAGKQDNPFVTTNMVWEAVVTPQGAVEVLELHKLFASTTAEDAKAAVSTQPWTLTFTAGQFIYGDREESFADSDGNTDGYQFVAQLAFGFDFGNGFKALIAPGWQTYTASADSGGIHLNDANIAPEADILGSTRDLNIVTVPGEIRFPVLGHSGALLWDFAYNFEGDARAREVYGVPGGAGVRDSLAYLIGLKIGKAAKAGEWEFYANWRQTGFASLNPNLIDANFNLGLLNARGVEVGLRYALTDFMKFGLECDYSWNLDRSLAVENPLTLKGAATGGNNTRVIQAELLWRF